MKILTFGASNSSKSINKTLATYASTVLKSGYEHAEIEVLDLNDFEMAIYSVDREAADGIPDAAHRFVQKVNDADGLIISFAEHNGYPPVAYRNIFDWASRINQQVYANKPALLMATSTGPGGASNALNSTVESAPFIGITVVASISVPSFQENFDTKKGCLVNAELISKVTQGTKALVVAAKA